MDVTITVTEKDIRNGRKGSRTSCPIALAGDRATNGRGCSADANTIVIGGRSYATPPVAATFIREFDRGGVFGGDVSPIEFTLVG